MRVLFLTGFILFCVLAWRRRHFVISVLVLLFGIWLVRYLQPISDWLRTLGADSLSEVQKFAWGEAFSFWRP